ncbi:MAG: hypothetical protein JO097_09890 [Acidobacteriaceae bacterium]|nr:hypothetical protein [Acidobacteriaceae bacterium]
MSIRTTVTFDEDVLERLKQESRVHGASFRHTLNELLRKALAQTGQPPTRREFHITPSHMGYVEGLNYDCTEVLLEYLEGPEHR